MIQAVKETMETRSRRSPGPTPPAPRSPQRPRAAAAPSLSSRPGGTWVQSCGSRPSTRLLRARLGFPGRST